MALKVPIDVLHARQLHPVLVHTPADATFAATRRLALLSLVESFAVTVGQVHGTGHHAWAGFELLEGSFHVSAAGALLRFLSHLRCRDDSGVGSVLRAPHKLRLGQLLSAVLLHSLGLQLGNASVLGPEDLRGVGLFSHLGGGGFLMLPRVSLYLGLLAVALFVEANPAAVQQGVQRLLLILPGEAAQTLGAALSVDATRLSLRQGASHAAATAGLFDQLTAQRAGGTHGQSFLVAGFTMHERAQALSRHGTGGQQQEDHADHHFFRVWLYLGAGQESESVWRKGPRRSLEIFFLKKISLAGRAGAVLQTLAKYEARRIQVPARKSQLQGLKTCNRLGVKKKEARQVHAVSGDPGGIGSELEG